MAPISQKRKDEIKETVLFILNAVRIHTLPVSLNDIVHHFNISCSGAESITTRSKTEKDDCYAYKKGISYYIIYDSTCPMTRSKFSIAYQLGHIFLGHFTNKTDEEIARNEANYFAKELLMPLAVLDMKNARTPEDISELCGVSLTAAELRAKDYIRRDSYKSKYGNTEYDSLFIKQFSKDMKRG